MKLKIFWRCSLFPSWSGSLYSSCSSVDGHHFNVHSSSPLVGILRHITPYETWGSKSLDHRYYFLRELTSRKTDVNLMDILRCVIVFLSSSKIHSDSTSITRRPLPYKSLKILQLYQSVAGSLNKPNIQNYSCASCSLTLSVVCLGTVCWECLDPRVRRGEGRDDRGNCIMWSFMTFNVRQIWLGRLNERNRAGRKRKEKLKKLLLRKLKGWELLQNVDANVSIILKGF
jgi:hypothetical protein